MTLRDWLKSHYLITHTTSPQEIQDLRQGAVRPGTISDHEADEMIKLAEELRGVIESWLNDKHPELV